MARKSGIGTLLSFDLERAGPSAPPLFQQLYRQLRQAVLEGRLRPGVRLPATRFLARELGLSRNTVLTAYDQLASEGFLELRHRSGVFVAEDLPIAEPVAVATPPTPAPRIGKRGEATLGSRPVTDPRSRRGPRRRARLGVGRAASPARCRTCRAFRSTCGRGCWRVTGGGRRRSCRSAAMPAGIPICAPRSRIMSARRAASPAIPITCWW